MAILCAVSLWLATPAASAATQATPQRNLPEGQVGQVLREWHERMESIDRLLVEGKAKKAYARAVFQLDEMTNRFVDGPSVGQFLGLATALRAVAAYDLGRPDEALWHWQVAQQMFPNLEGVDLTRYGEAGTFLSQAENTRLVDEAEGREAGVSPPKFERLEVEPPRRKSAPQPQIPAAKRVPGLKVSVEVMAIIGRDGSVRNPIIRRSEGELTLVCRTLDVLRRWKFKPAEVAGEPVEVFYSLRANFEVPGR